MWRRRRPVVTHLLAGSIGGGIPREALFLANVKAQVGGVVNMLDRWNRVFASIKLQSQHAGRGGVREEEWSSMLDPYTRQRHPLLSYGPSFPPITSTAVAQAANSREHVHVRKAAPKCSAGKEPRVSILRVLIARTCVKAVPTCSEPTDCVPVSSHTSAFCESHAPVFSARLSARACVNAAPACPG